MSKIDKSDAPEGYIAVAASKIIIVMSVICSTCA